MIITSYISDKWPFRHAIIAHMTVATIRITHAKDFSEFLYLIKSNLFVGGGAQFFWLERGDKPVKGGEVCRNGGVATFLLLYSLILFTVRVWGN